MVWRAWDAKITAQCWWDVEAGAEECGPQGVYDLSCLSEVIAVQADLQVLHEVLGQERGAPE